MKKPSVCYGQNGYLVQYSNDYRLYYEDGNGNYEYWVETWSVNNNNEWFWNDSNGLLVCNKWVWAETFKTASYCCDDYRALTNGWGIHIDSNTIYHFDSTGYVDQEY